MMTLDSEGNPHDKHLNITLVCAESRTCNQRLEDTASKMAKWNKAEVQIGNDYLTIGLPNLKPITINFEWLRDHCRCKLCYNEITKQRILNILDVQPNIQPLECALSDGVVRIRWDDAHKSEYQLNWLMKNGTFLADYQKDERISWLKMPDAAKVDLDCYMNTGEGLRSVMKSLLRYGVAFVTGVETTLEATERVVTRMAPVQKTFFGQMWELNHDTETVNHKDTAYTQDALGAHTDNTYWTDAAGLQIFHCFKSATSGGETLLVDGLGVVQQLKQEDPECYERLTQTPISATYVEDDQYHTHVDPIIKLDPVTKELLQIRFNLYDRSVLRSIRQTEVAQHYRDLRVFASMVGDPLREWWIPLTPGEVIFIDNWRVLHGRSSYSGTRHLGGCYISRTDWQSKAAILGLLS